MATLMNPYEIVMKLIGPIHPIGETNTDETRLKNLKELTLLVDKLLFEINSAAQNASRPEASMKAIGNHARDFIRDIRNAVEKEPT